VAYDSDTHERHKQVSSDLQHFETCRLQRTDFDVKWQLVGDYQLPRRDFSVVPRPGQLWPHKVVSSVATNAGARMAALVLTYWFDLTRPNLLPNVKYGLAVQGRDTGIDDAGIGYLSKLAWNVSDHMLRPKAKLLVKMDAALREFVHFGCGVMWTGRRRGFGPFYNNRPLSACWWSEDDEGVIDTLFYRMKLPLYRVFQRWPHAEGLWPEQHGEPAPSEMEFQDILMACKPRPGGRAGAVPEAKPWAMRVIAEQKNALLEESGFDSFPYQVFRYGPQAGQVYAEGPGCQVQPDVMVLNHLCEAIEDVASQRAKPPLATPVRMFGKTLDRRAGALNAYNPSALGLQKANEAIIKMDFTGDPTEAIALKESLIQDIEMGFFVDWLRLRDNGDVTAEEIRERRDMRLRGMSSIVAHLADPSSSMGDRSMEIMVQEGQIEPGPPSVAGANVEWEYAGPLQIAQLMGNVQAVLQLINARGLVAEQDPSAARAVDLEECLRVIHEGLAAPTTTLVPAAKVQQEREAMQQEQQQQADAQKAQAVAGAVKDAGAGVSDLAGVRGPPGAAPGGPPGAAPASPASPIPFAPVSPFSAAA
jgi:hypothetical protein